MGSRFLIINPPSEYFFYIPMGTFALCDYLEQRGIAARILNLSLYREDEVHAVLDQHLSSFRPSHVGLILHWQDTTEGFLNTGEYMRPRLRGGKIICGGFTAGYFGASLLNECEFADYVIKGDPEKPVEMLLRDADHSEIPNLIYRSEQGIAENKVSYAADEQALSDMSFSNLGYLCDHQLYLSAINKKLGFPVFVGRGCRFNCRYCGGSRSAYRLHSARKGVVVRSVDSIIRDLHSLKNFTDRIYICHENDRDYIKSLFRAIAEDKGLVKIFHMNYGAWMLPDRELLNLYREAFVTNRSDRPVFELSPEVFDDQARRHIKPGKVHYSLRALKENLSLIGETFGDEVNVSVFFSRYHDSIGTYEEMKREISGISMLKHELLCDRIMNAKIFYDHLSTDVAGQYWETYVAENSHFGTLTSSIRRIRNHEQYNFTFDNLCIYMPRKISDRDIVRCEQMISVLKTLEMHFHEMFHIMFACFGPETVDLIETIVTHAYSDNPDRVFTSRDHTKLLDHISAGISKAGTLFPRMPFIRDLCDLNIRKARYLQKSLISEDLSGTDKSGLNHDLLSINDHDYLDLTGFLQRLKEEGPHSLTPEKTVFIFLADEILSMSYTTYEATLKEFEKGISIDEYYALMNSRGIFSHQYHRDLIEKLCRCRVLHTN